MLQKKENCVNKVCVSSMVDPLCQIWSLLTSFPIWIRRLFFFPFVTEFIMVVCIDVLFSPLTSIFVFYVCPENDFVPENLFFRLCACWFVGPCHFGPPSSFLAELFARDSLWNGNHSRSSVTSFSHRLFGGFRFVKVEIRYASAVLGCSIYFIAW